MNAYSQLIASIVKGNAGETKFLVERALGAGQSPLELISGGFIPAMAKVSQLFDENNFALTHLILAARSLQEGLSIIKNLAEFPESPIKVIIGTIHGDIHDIGKNIFKVVLEASGIETIDLGVNVSPRVFLQTLLEEKPQFICITALISICVPNVKATIKLIEEAGLRNCVKIIVGGVPFTRQLALSIGADAYATNVFEGLAIIRSYQQQRLGNNGEISTEIKSITRDIDINNLNQFLRAITNNVHFNIRLVSDPIKIQGLKKLPTPNGEEIYSYLCPLGYTEVFYPIYFENQLIASLVFGHFSSNISCETDKYTCQFKNSMDSTCLTSEMIHDIVIISQTIKSKIADQIEKQLIANQLSKNFKSLNTFVTQQHRLELLVKEAEFKALQAQVNPHFLFNTLNTISNVALFENAPQTQKLINSISRLLRYSLTNMDSTVTIEQELKIINDYLFIQTVRFNDRINFSIDVEKRVAQGKIPCMIIQPIVENAIIHGLEPAERGGTLSIKGRYFDNLVVITIDDTGLGISQSKIMEVNLMQMNNTEKSSKGLGIVNVLSRLRYYFGKNCSFEIKRSTSGGTVVEMTFPLTF